MPVGFTMALVSLAGFCLLASPQASLSVLARDIFATLSSYSLTVIPMFIFMGAIVYSSGMSRRLYDAGYVVYSGRDGAAWS